MIKDLVPHQSFRPELFQRFYVSKMHVQKHNRHQEKSILIHFYWACAYFATVPAENVWHSVSIFPNNFNFLFHFFLFFKTSNKSFGLYPILYSFFHVFFFQCACHPLPCMWWRDGRQRLPIKPTAAAQVWSPALFESVDRAGLLDAETSR